MESVRDALGKFGKKVVEATKQAEDLAGNVWQHLRTGPSIADAAMGRIAQGTKVIAEGGYDRIFRQTFDTLPEEQLKKSYACYLSTSAGPVMGILYLSSAKLAFCSDNPLSYKVGDQTEWSYYKVVIPLHQLRQINPSASKVNRAEKYIQIISVDNHEFWFMGFVNYDSAVMCLQEALDEPVAAGVKRSAQAEQLPRDVGAKQKVLSSSDLQDHRVTSVGKDSDDQVPDAPGQRSCAARNRDLQTLPILDLPLTVVRGQLACVARDLRALPLLDLPLMVVRVNIDQVQAGAFSPRTTKGLDLAECAVPCVSPRLLDRRQLVRRRFTWPSSRGPTCIAGPLASTRDGTIHRRLDGEDALGGVGGEVFSEGEYPEDVEDSEEKSEVEIELIAYL
ncbi:hypothetical protein Taro_037210 [Colocasia esculenta]|uniref:GRAM domain-containing protein n=1 Tax=Colocasia esculenta TaxID=4460 RepID=A0A843WIJ4_COLES|nr:hypothetical protein [Colocasia esculenta]